MIAALLVSVVLPQEITLKGTARTSEEHDAIYSKTVFPYVVEIKSKSGTLLFLGPQHIYDPANPQFEKIKEAWQDFKPDIALIESRTLSFSGSLEDAAKRGEPFFVLALAKQSKTDVGSLEPDPKVEGAALAASETPERAHLFLTLRNYFSKRRTQPNIGDANIQLSLAFRANEYGLSSTLKTVADLDALWKADFPSLDWRTVEEKVMWPGKEHSYLNRLANISNKIRDDHWAKKMVGLVRAGKRVFVVGGASHVICLEPILRETLAESR